MNTEDDLKILAACSTLAGARSGKRTNCSNFMKSTLITLLLIAVVALGTFSAHQRNQIARTRTRLAAAEDLLKVAQNRLKEMSDAAEKVTQAEQNARILQQTLTEASAASAAQSQQVTQLQQSLAAAQTNTGRGLGALFKDPQMKDMIKAQQKMVMGPMIDKMYGALFQELNLTPEQSAGLKDLLMKKMLAAADVGMSMFDGSLDAAKRKEMAAQIKTQTDAFDEQIKQYLGDENYQAFQSYEKTTPDRMVVSQLQDQLAASGTGLDPAQQQQLVQALSDARQNFKWTTDFNNQKPGDGDFAEMFSEDRVNQFALEKAQFDQQFLERARQILTPEQLAAFEKFQEAQRQLQITGMKMAAKMFAPQSP
jgi:hypothetical protein